VPEVIAEGGVWSQRVTGKMPGKEVVGRRRERRAVISGAVGTHCVCDFVHLSFLSAGSDRIIYALVLPNEGSAK